MEANIDQTPIRWLHLSDFHVGKDDYAQRKLFQEIISYVHLCGKRGFAPDLVFITGDVANSGKPNEYTKFTSEFLVPLQKILDVNAKEIIFIVPGNHDVIKDTHKYFDRDEICQENSQFFDPTIQGQRDREQVLPRFASYSDSPYIIPCKWLNTEQGCYIHTLNIKNVKLGIVCINTAWISKCKEDRHKLSPGINLLEDALIKLDGCNVKIVLGHHPIDWFHDEHVPPIRTILGQHHALYLHGHLHKNRVSPEEGAGHGFMCLQNGAAFQTRENDIWVNGLTWGELDLAKAVLRLQPREWNPNNRDWQLGKDLPEMRRLSGDDWWIFPLPGVPDSQRLGKPLLPEQPVRYPVGWQPVDLAFLDRQRESLDKALALRFFDGAIPDWRIALSAEIPRLAIVGRVSHRLISYTRADRLQIVLLIGPSGEGKSTALMQTVYSVLQAKNMWKVLWRVDESVPLSPEEILQLPQVGIPWLLASDAADIIASDLYRTCQLLRQSQRNDIRFLLACRDTDWKASGAHKLEWITYADLQQETTSGLGEDDALAIIKFWAAFGNEAMGKLTGVDITVATKELLSAAKHEAAIREGSLLGALLKVRYGNDLKEHVKVLMKRLAERRIIGGSDLLLAFSYIAAMHVEDLRYLSRTVLAEALGCRLERINSLVLAPLGMEATISSDAQYIFTRHREIARAVLSLLQDVFEEDIDELYINLVKSAFRLKTKGVFVPLLNGWCYGIPDRFFAKGNKDLAIRIGEMLLELNPANLSFRIRLSRYYRRADSAGRATGLFQNLKTVIKNRNAVTEWGISAHTAGRHPFGATLLAFSLADQADSLPPNNNQAKICFFSLSEIFSMLYNQYHDMAFNNGFFAVVKLCLTLKLEEKIRDSLLNQLKESGKEAIGELNLDSELSCFQDAVVKVWKLCGPYLEILQTYITTPSEMKFQGLRWLLSNALQRGLSNVTEQGSGVKPSLFNYKNIC